MEATEADEILGLVLPALGAISHMVDFKVLA
jgi:hypothetical protein